MTKQEKIREIVARQVHINERIWAKIYHVDDPHNCIWEDLSEYHRELYLASANEILGDLHSQGVVIRVNRIFPDSSLRVDKLEKIANKFPAYGGGDWERNVARVQRNHTEKLIQKAGFVATEPLIEEGK